VVVSRALDDLLFDPRSILIYGASSDPEKLSGRPLDFLSRFGFAGDLYAINPHRERVQGVAAYPTVADVPGPIDLVVIVVPAVLVPGAIEECAAHGIGAAIVFASGFAELPSGAGVLAQEEIRKVAHRSGLRVLGPNCLGSFSEEQRAFATFSTAFDGSGDRIDGSAALVTQSGAVGSFTYSAMNATGVGVRYFANTGNEADITTVELLAALADRDDVEVLLGHLERMPNIEELTALATKAAQAKKPLILLKAGRTPSGAKAIAAHTASKAGDDSAFTSALTSHGGIRARSMEDMVDLALAFKSTRRAVGRKLTIITMSGGAGALACDAAVDEGLIIEPWDEASRIALAAHLPYFASTANPLDVTGAMINDVGLLARALEAASNSAQTNSVLVVLGNAEKAAADLVETIRTFSITMDKPLFVSWTGGSGRPRAELLAAGVPTYSEPVRAVRALARLVEFGLGVHARSSAN
jgi:acetate---CoA ligase (ADP-forming)